MGDWLGNGRVSNQQRIFWDFKKARAYVRNLGLKNNQEWRSYSKGLMQGKSSLPTDIPTAPERTYKDQGWLGYGDWLGTGTIAARLRSYRGFKEARSYVHTLKLNSSTDWKAFCLGKLPQIGTKPDDIPANPSLVYKNKGWTGFGDWLGTGRTRSIREKILQIGRR
jgi:hypothetical protein